MQTMAGTMLVLVVRGHMPLHLKVCNYKCDQKRKEGGGLLFSLYTSLFLTNMAISCMMTTLFMVTGQKSEFQV